MGLNKQITINEVLSAISRHRFKAVITFVLLMTIVSAAFILLPRKYGSEGRLFVQLGRTGTGLDPTPGGTSISIQDSRETEIRSVVEIVKSRAILEKVVEEVGADEILASAFSRFEWAMPEFPWNAPQDETDKVARQQYKQLRQRDLAAEAIEDALTVHAEKKTSVISVYCKAHSPALAQKIVNEIMEATMAKHVEVHAIEDSHSFFMSNFNKKQDKLVAAELSLANFRNSNGYLSIEGARESQQYVINKIELELIDAEANYLQSKQRLDDIKRQMARIEPTIQTPRKGIEKLSTEDSRTELFKLESELRRLEKTHSPDHPRLKPLQEAVASLQSEFAAMPDDRVESATQINPVFEKIKVTLVNANADTSAFKRRWENLKTKYVQAVERLKVLNSKELEANQLKREMSLAKQEMDIYIRKRTESAVIEELNKKRISNVVVAQDANLMVKHVSPRGSVFIPLGAMLSTLCAIGTALYFEKDLLSGHLSEDELEQILEIPVLVSLPRVQSQRNMVG